MREITKIITLPVGEESMPFRLTKLDAFSGGRLLKLLSATQGKAEGNLTLYDFLFSLEDAEFDSVIRVCLAHAEAQLPAGFIPVYRDQCWGLPELEYETRLCLKLTLEVMAFSLESFFPGSGLTSSRGEEASSRQSR